MRNEHFVKNSFDRLIHSFPGNKLDFMDQQMSNSNFNLGGVEILNENNENNVINENNFTGSYFCNNDCSSKFFEFIYNGSKTLNIQENNNLFPFTEQIRLLLGNSYNYGYNEGLFSSQLSSKQNNINTTEIDKNNNMNN